MFNKENNIFDYIFAILTSILIATGVAVSFYAELIPTIIVLPIITLIFGILSIILIAVGYYYRKYLCVTEHLIASIVGSIISSSFAIAAISLTSGALTSSILVGIVAFFLTINLIFSIASMLCLMISRRRTV